VATGAALHDEAIRQLTSATHTEYSHDVDVDESRGVYEYDCSAFVGYAIGNVAPAALDAVRLHAGKQRPTASSYVHVLRNITPGKRRGPWLHVASVAELQAGDIVAWLAASDKPDAFGVVNTGHVMIVDGPAHERSPGEWVVPVIDSSDGHGAADLRKATHTTGLGRGNIVLVVTDGYVKAYRWTESPRSVVSETSIMLGRLE
jgi:hypothetical protein